MYTYEGIWKGGLIYSLLYESGYSPLPARFRIYDLQRHVFGAWHEHLQKHRLLEWLEHADLFIESELMELNFTPGCLFSSLRLWVCGPAVSSFIARHVETGFEKVTATEWERGFYLGETAGQTQLDYVSVCVKECMKEGQNKDRDGL
jgi:hypothetical protein